MAILRVKEPFSVDVDGSPRVFTAGQLVDSTNPAVKGREHLFETIDEWMGQQPGAGGVEQATAAPGEKRSLGKRSAVKPSD